LIHPAINNKQNVNYKPQFKKVIIGCNDKLATKKWLLEDKLVYSCQNTAA